MGSRETAACSSRASRTPPRMIEYLKIGRCGCEAAERPSESCGLASCEYTGNCAVSALLWCRSLTIKTVNSKAGRMSSIAARAKMRGRCENLDFKGPGAGKGTIPHRIKRQLCCRTEEPKNLAGCESSEGKTSEKRAKRKYFAHITSFTYRQSGKACTKRKIISRIP